MGGCCCHASRTLSDGAPVHSYNSGQIQHLPSTHGTQSVVPVVPSVPSLDNLAPDASEEPNSVSAHGDFVSEQTNIGSTESHVRKNEHAQPTYSVADGNAGRGTLLECSDTYDGLKKSQNRGVLESVCNSPRVKKDMSNVDSSIILGTDDEDVCPICLEEYDAQNPKIITQCKHNFHLSCILEWMERSSACPICDKVMKVDDMAL